MRTVTQEPLAHPEEVKIRVIAPLEVLITQLKVPTPSVAFFGSLLAKRVQHYTRNGPSMHRKRVRLVVRTHR